MCDRIRDGVANGNITINKLRDPYRSVTDQILGR